MLAAMGLGGANGANGVDSTRASIDIKKVLAGKENAITPPATPHGAYFTSYANTLKSSKVQQVYQAQAKVAVQEEDPAYTAS